MTAPPRARAQAIAARRGGQHTLAVPLALRLAARIQERPLAEFFTDPTQLANGLNDFLGAVVPDGLVVTDPEVLAEEVTESAVDGLAGAERIGTALEATRRLRSTVGDGAVLLAALPGPGAVAEARSAKQEAGPIIETLAKEFLGAGVDVLLFRESSQLADFEASLRTIANMARFHRSLVYLQGASVSFVEEPVTVPLEDPRPASGLVLTESELDTGVDITLVQDWVATVGG